MVLPGSEDETEKRGEMVDLPFAEEKQHLFQEHGKYQTTRLGAKEVCGCQYSKKQLIRHLRRVDTKSELK